MISTSRPAEPAARSGGIAFWVLLSIAAVALGAGLVLLSRSSVLHARGVEVTGASHLTRAEIVGAAGVSKATNVLWLDEGAVERAIETDPWVADASVHVRLPWTIEIAVVERVPVAVASDGALRTLVAADGTALGPAGNEHGLPRISLPSRLALDGAGESPRGAAIAIGAMPSDLLARVDGVKVFADGSLVVRVRGGVVVRYGQATEPVRKASVLERVLRWAGGEGESLAVVNLVAPDAPAVRFGA